MTSSLVTGGSGYFGSLLARHLVDAGHRVRVLDIHDADDLPDGVEFMLGDIRDASAVDRAVDGCDVVFNSVAQVPLAHDQSLLRTVNADGTAVLANSALRHGVRKMVHISSSAVFGVPASNPVLPSTIPSPAEAYGHAKLAAEWACLESVTRGLDVTIVRPRTILGHGRLGIFGILFDWIADGADVFVLGTGDNRYQFIHADDLARACVLAVGVAGPAVFNAGTDRFGTMRESLESLCAHAGTGAHVRSLPVGPAALMMRAAAAAHLAPFAPYHWLMYGQSLWFDVTKAREELGWTPAHANTSMLIESYEWFLQHRTDTDTEGRSRHRSPVPPGVVKLLRYLP